MTPSDDTVPWRSLYAEASRRLPEREARWIVEEASGYEGPEFALGLDEPATVRGVARFDRLLARRLAGEPLQYVLGRWGFRTLDLMVDRRVLIPRPETEQVVEVALGELDRLATDREAVVVDLGTGSGAIALSIAAERRRTAVWATDVSADALAVAGANLAGLGRAATRVRLAEGSWYDALPPSLAGEVDLVVSNPPYVAPGDPLPADVAEWEPVHALLAGPTGLECLQAVVTGAPAWLRRPGALVVELAPHQAAVVAGVAREVGFDEVRIERDLAGRDRAVVARVGPRP